MSEASKYIYNLIMSDPDFLICCDCGDAATAEGRHPPCGDGCPLDDPDQKAAS